MAISRELKIELWNYWKLHWATINGDAQAPDVDSLFIEGFYAACAHLLPYITLLIEHVHEGSTNDDHMALSIAQAIRQAIGENDMRIWHEAAPKDYLRR